MMKSFESVYKELEDLFIKHLPDYIEKVNKTYNDGILLKPFENETLDEECLRYPCFKFMFEETEYSEKDRLIENNKFTISLDIKIPFNEKKMYLKFSRYIDAINLLLKEESINDINKIKIIKISNKKCYIEISTFDN